MNPTKSLRRAMSRKSGVLRDVPRDQLRRIVRRVAAAEERHRRDLWS